MSERKRDGAEDATEDQRVQPSKASPFWKVLGFWVPRRFVSSSGIEVSSFVRDLNNKIHQRGFVLWDGQILTAMLDPDYPIEVAFEPSSLDEPFDIPPRREWNELQRDFFRLNDPYQMADEPDQFTWSSITTRIVEPYLDEGELISAVVHGEDDHYYFYCPCHFATVVCTTRHRLVCMSCGATHVVLREPLPFIATTLLSAADWHELFDEGGSRRHEEVDLMTVDFRDIESAEPIWKTNQWEEAAHELVFFARSSPDEIEAAIRGTERDPSIFMEAGWSRIETQPPPAYQLMAASVQVDLVENALYALSDGVASFVAAYNRPERLLGAIPQLFRAIELLFKARLQIVDLHAIDDHPNNPILLRRLQHHGVSLTTDEVETLVELRDLRNDLQHGTSTFNHRTGLTLCRDAVVLIDRFVESELGLWVGDAIEGNDWRALLAIPEIATTAERIVGARLAPYRGDSSASIESCMECHRSTLLRPHPSSGASCAYCGHVPTYRGE